MCLLVIERIFDLCVVYFDFVDDICNDKFFSDELVLLMLIPISQIHYFAFCKLIFQFSILIDDILVSLQSKSPTTKKNKKKIYTNC